MDHYHEENDTSPEQLGGDEIIVGSFTISAPDGRKTEPIPYNASIKEIKKKAAKVGIVVEELWNGP